MAESNPADVTRVEDDERLFRRVVYLDSRGYSVVNGAARVSSQAFSDRRRRPSVDRECLAQGGPQWTQEGADNGVLVLGASVVRATKAEKKDHKGRLVREHSVDVVHEPVLNSPPLRDNPAHSVIEAAPEIDSEKTFRRLIERLALLAQWEVLPLDARATSSVCSDGDQTSEDSLAAPDGSELSTGS